MTLSAWLAVAVLIVFIAGGTRLLGPYLAKVLSPADATPGDRLFRPVERFVYRLTGVDERREQRWSTYAVSLLAFSLVSVLVVYLLQRIQQWLPLDPTGAPNVRPALAWNTAVSFVTNTDWQNYAGESSMAHITQMLALTVQNFASAAVGLCVAVALIRGLVRRRATTIGNFWVDLVRVTFRVLFPLALVLSALLVSQGVVQNLHGFRTATTVEGATQVVPGGPVASQEAIKELGTNGGGFYNANSAHPFENPSGLVNLLEVGMLLLIPFSMTYAYGRMVGDQRQGWVVFGAMIVLWAAMSTIAVTAETKGNPELARSGVDQQTTSTQAGGNAEGKEVRLGPVGSGLFASSTTGTSTGATNSAHDSYTPVGGMAPLVNMMLGEVDPGGVGSGLYGMLIFVLMSVFIAGLMVGRTPEYLGKKIQAEEMKLVMIYLLAVPLVVLTFAGASVVISWARDAALNQPGPHGLTEIVYAFVSAGNNNGSAFAGLSSDTGWYNTTLGLAMLAGRFFLMIPVLAIAGSLARKQPVPPSAGTFPTGTPLFAGLLVGVVVIVVGLTYFPVLALGPIVEHLSM